MRKPNRCASYLWQRRYGQLKVGEKAGKSDGEGEQRGRDTGRSMKGAERFTRWRSPRSAAVAVSARRRRRPFGNQGSAAANPGRVLAFRRD